MLSEVCPAKKKDSRGTAVKLNKRLPPKWDNRRKTYVRNDDWLLWNIQSDGKLEEPHS
jgi:hypothetical protein